MKRLFFSLATIATMAFAWVACESSHEEKTGLFLIENGSKWGYMNKIIRNWYEKGLFTAEDVETKDRRRSGHPPKKGEAPRDLDELLSRLDTI